MPDVLESRLAVFAGLTIGYGLLATSAYELFGALAIGVTFFPPAGLTFAAFLLLPYRMWPAIAAGIVVGEVGANLVQGQDVWWSLGWAGANLVEPVVGATLTFHLARELAVTRHFGAAFLVGGLVMGPIAGSVLGATILELSSQLPWWDSVTDVLIGDALGVLVVAPIVMVIVRPELFVPTRHPDRDAFLVAGLTTGAVLLIVLVESQPIGYAAVPLLAVPAVRYGAKELSLAGLVVASVLTAATARGLGPWASRSPEGAHADLVQQQAFILVALGGAWLLRLEVLERVAAGREAEAAQRRLLSAERAARDERHLAAMHDVLSELSAASTSDEVLHTVEDHAGSVVDAIGVLVVLEDETGSIEVVGTWGRLDRSFDVGEILDPMVDLPVVVATNSGRPALGGPEGRKVAMPLNVGGRRGALGLYRTPDVPWSENSQIRALAFASIVADALARTEQYEVEHGVALALQRAIMPGPIKSVDGLRLAGRYLPATASLEVGGDWYDVVVDRARRSAMVVIGDVAGHSLEAAATMGQLAAGARALAFAEQHPSELVDCLDDMHCNGPNPVMTTLVCARLDLDEQRLLYCVAGHPPPLMRTPAGVVTQLAGGRSTPLGVVNEAQRSEATIDLLAGTTLLFYTDGLVEQRNTSLTDRIDELAEVFGAAPDDPDEACDAIIDAMLSGVHEDDVAVVVLAVD